MAETINGHWKLLCGYFLTDCLMGSERANITEQCLCKLHDIGVHVCSVTCDGPSCNLSGDLSASRLEILVPHPADSSL